MSTKSQKTYPILLLILGVILLIKFGQMIASQHIIEAFSRSTVISADPSSPGMSPSIQWHNTIIITPSVFASLSATNGAPWPQIIKYSDESEGRNLSLKGIGDYAVVEIRMDSKSNMLYIRTTDNCWGGARNPNWFICKFDLIKRKCISRYEVTPRVLHSMSNTSL